MALSLEPPPARLVVKPVDVERQNSLEALRRKREWEHLAMGRFTKSWSTHD